MEKHFKKHIGNFQSADLSNAKEMDIKVSDMIIQEVLPQDMWEKYFFWDFMWIYFFANFFIKLKIIANDQNLRFIANLYNVLSFLQ